MTTSIGQFRSATSLGLAWRTGVAQPWAWVGVALGAVYLPHVIAYTDNLMSRPHYQFFPMAWLGALVLGWSRRAELRRDAAEAGGPGDWALVGLGVALLATAGWLGSAWLAMASVPVMVLGLGGLVGGSTAAWALVPAVILFATTIRLPGLLDLILIRNLRTLAVAISSRVLDALGIIHVPLTNVLRVRGGNLMVDEACSGVNSLVSIMAVVLFLGLLLRRGPIRLALLLVWAAGVVVLANVGRVTIVTVAFDRYQVDLLHGWRHDALGLAIYAVSLGLVASLDQLWLLFAPLFQRPGSRPGRSLAAGSERVGPGWTGGQPHRLALLAVVLGGVALIVPTQWARGVLPSPVGTGLVDRKAGRVHETIGENSLPDDLAGWRRVNYRVEERARQDLFGQYSSCWEYHLGTLRAVVCLDYPFVGWHELPACYQSINWTLEGRSVGQVPLTDQPGPTLPAVMATLTNPTGEHAVLRFALLDDRGVWVEPQEDLGLGLLTRERARGTPGERPTVQIQVFSSGFRVLGDEDRRQQEHLFRSACAILQGRLSPTMAAGS